MPLSRLTRREYNNTLKDLLGDASHPADAFPNDTDQGFGFRRAGLVAQQDAELLRSAAEVATKTALGHLDQLLPCAPASGEDACAAQFIDKFGRRAYRRPLTDGEKTRLSALYGRARSELGLDFAGAIGVLIEAVLQSPAFLYHWGSPEAALVMEQGVARLDGYELGSRLAYFLLGTMPDDALLDAAASLSTPASIEIQAQRLLADPRARDSVSAFMQELLELDRLPDQVKDPALYPEFNDALIRSLLEENRSFVQHVVFDDTGSFGALLSADYSYVNQALGGVYGISDAAGIELQKHTLKSAERSGILTQAGFLTLTGANNGSHPVRRGHAVYEKFLCGVLPPPPPNVPPAEPATAGGTTRQRFERHDQNACARACHSLMDPIGFAFEHYDGIGKYRTMDNGGVVDSSGEIMLDGKKAAFADAVALSQLFAESEEVRTCFTRQVLRYALRRDDVGGDAVAVEQARAAFAQSGNDIKRLFVAVPNSVSFRYRTPASGEQIQ